MFDDDNVPIRSKTRCFSSVTRRKPSAFRVNSLTRPWSGFVARKSCVLEARNIFLVRASARKICEAVLRWTKKPVSVFGCTSSGEKTRY